MADMNKISDEALASVVGGVTRRVHNDAVNYANLRDAAGLDSDVIMKLENGTYVETTGRTKTKDGYTWYQVYVIGAEDCFGWISGSLIGY
jgi:uncharacterized protein YgiM (DUF1202 family)